MRILVINPPSFCVEPIDEVEHIFMAPYVLASNLRSQGIDCQVFDFIDERTRLNGWGDGRFIFGISPCGNYANEKISKRVFYLGRKQQEYVNYLTAYKPNEVWISCLFTYNWQAAKLVADLTKEFNPLIKVKLGGVYATLCSEHAKKNISSVDEVVVSSPLDNRRFQNIDISFYKSIPSTFPILTSLGCYNHCNWCAVGTLEGNTMQYKDPMSVVLDIEEKYYYGVHTFRFMDSNLLANYDNHLKIILKEIIRRKINAQFLSYGGVNTGLVTQEILELMAQAGFKNLCLPVEFIDEKFLQDNDRPISLKQWESVVNKIQKIKGFAITSYVLCGMPNQTIRDIYKAMIYVKDKGVNAVPLFFTPIPSTKWEDTTNRPLEHLHPFLFPYASEDLSVKELEQFLMNYYHHGVYVSDYIQGQRYSSSTAIFK